MTGNDLPGALAGIRVVELAGEASAYAGLLLAGMGAEVIVVEPPDGHHTRGFEPFLQRRARSRAQPLVVALQRLQAGRDPGSRG